MRLSNAKLAFLSCVVLVFVAGYARSELAQLYSGIIGWGTAKDGSTESATTEQITEESADVVPPANPPADRPAPTANSSLPPPTPQPPPTTRTGDIGQALEGVGPGGLDQNLVNQRQEYLKNLNTQLKEQHGGVLPSTTSTTAPPDEDTPPSPDLLPQNVPNMSVPVASPPGWVEPPPQLRQSEPPGIVNEDEIEDPEEVGEDEDLEPEEDEDDSDTAEEDEEDTTEDVVE